MATTGYEDQPNKSKSNEPANKKFNDDEIKKLVLMKKKWPKEKLVAEIGKGVLSEKQKKHLAFQKWRYEQGFLTEYMEEKYDNH